MNKKLFALGVFLVICLSVIAERTVYTISEIDSMAVVFDLPKAQKVQLSGNVLGASAVQMIGPDQVLKNYTLKNHPRIWFDGPNGTISNRLKDPDGSGSQKNPNFDRLPAQGLVSRVTTTRAGCLVNGEIKNCRGIGELASDSAFLWWMCNQCKLPWDANKTYLDFAKELYLNYYDYGFKRWFGSHKFGDALAPDAGDDPSGMVDYGGPTGAIAVAGYSIIHSELTPEERIKISKYFVNGMLPEDYCAYPSVRSNVKVAKNSDTVISILDGASWPANTEVGDWIDVKAYKDASGNIITSNQAPNGYWAISGIIQAKTATTITMKIGSGGSWMPNFSEGYIFTYPSFQENTCGMQSVFMMHSDTPRYMEPLTPNNTRALAADVPAIPWDVSNVDGVTQVITIADSSTWNLPDFTAPTPSNPWKAVLGGGDWGAELVLIENISGNKVTIRRGLYHHTERTHTRCASWDPACNSPRGITVISKVSYGTRNYNTGLNNRELTRAQSALAIGLAFADDDPRASVLLKRAGDYFSTDSHKWAERFFTLTNYSIASYQYGRGVYYGRMAMFLKNSIEAPSVDYYDSGNNLKDQYLVYPYWARPWAMDEVVEAGLDGNWFSCYWDLNAQRDCGQLAFMAQLTHPGSDEAKYAWSFLTGPNTYTLSSVGSVWAGTDYFGEGMITWLALLAGYPNDIQQATDRNLLSTTYARTHGDSQFPGGSGFKIGVSRTNWNSDATYGFAIAHDAFSDKLTGEGTLVSYGIGKNGWHIYSPGFRQRFQNNFHNNQVDFGNETKTPYYLGCAPSVALNLPDGLCPHHNYPSYSTAKNNFLWMSSELSALHKGGYGNLNLHGLNRHYRQFIHIKASGSATKDYFVVMDDIDKSVNEKYRVRTMYVQNGETVTMPNGSRTYTEGKAYIAPDFNSVESFTGGGEGPASKLLSKWLFTGGATVNAVYDLPIKITSSSDSNQTLTVCADATPSMPCRVKVGLKEYSFNSPIGTITFNPSNDADLREIIISFDPNTGNVNVRWDSGIQTAPVCGGLVVCVGQVGSAVGAAWTEALTNKSELLLFRYKWSYSGAPYDGCLHDQTMRTGSPNFHVGTCSQIVGPTSGFAQGKFDGARAVNVEAAPGMGGRLWMVHKATLNLSETLADGVALPVTGNGVNHEGFQVDEGVNSIVTVLPIANARATAMSFVTTHSNTARVLVAGVAPGIYTLKSDDISIQTGIVVTENEPAFMVSNVPAGVITVTSSGSVSDILPPAISSISAYGIGTSTATIFWATSELSDTQVEYGTTLSYGNSTTLKDTATRVTDHTTILTGLTPNTTYNYRVKSRDAAGNLGISSNLSFQTLSINASPSSTPVSTSTLPTISSFSASPSTINVGQSATLSWSVVGATLLSINQGVGSVTGTTRTVSPSVTTTYTLTAVNSFGTSTRTALVNVNTSTTTPPVSSKPTGSFDGVDTTKAFGWASDSDTPNTGIDVHLYIDKNAGTAGATPILVKADENRSDVGAHAFNYIIPEQYRDSKPHSIWAWAIDSSGVGGNNIQLTGSPKSFTLAPTVVVQPPPVPTATTTNVLRTIHIDLEGTTLKVATGVIQFVNSTNSTVVNEIPFTTNTNGDFSFYVPISLPSTIFIRVKINGYLPKKLDNPDLTNATPSTLNIPKLPAGDFNGDGVINSLDYAFLSQNWHKPASSYDINQDGVINSLDYSILSRNWNKVGE